jgi:pimeloyl-ACP methyl ester carboxylesterase
MVASFGALSRGYSGQGQTRSMHILVNGFRLFVDVEGLGLVPDGAQMRQKPMLILLHGGPGFDHSGFKPGSSQQSGIVQIVDVDHRGNGRGEHGDPAHWNLAQWGDDVRGSMTPSTSTLRSTSFNAWTFGPSWVGYAAPPC